MKLPGDPLTYCARICVGIWYELGRARAVVSRAIRARCTQTPGVSVYSRRATFILEFRSDLVFGEF